MNIDIEELKNMDIKEIEELINKLKEIKKQKKKTKNNKKKIKTSKIKLKVRPEDLPPNINLIKSNSPNKSGYYLVVKTKQKNILMSKKLIGIEYLGKNKNNSKYFKLTKKGREHKEYVLKVDKNLKIQLYTFNQYNQPFGCGDKIGLYELFNPLTDKFVF